jgi:hypothetical protein
LKSYEIGSKPIPEWVKFLVNSGNVIFKTDGWCEAGNKFTRYSAPIGFYLVLDDDGKCRTCPPDKLKEVKSN